MEKEAKDIAIELSGFREVEVDAMDLIDKMLQKQKHKILTRTIRPERLHITLKPVHKREKSEIYEIHANLFDNGKLIASEAEDRNLLTAIDLSLTRIIKELEKKNKD